MPSKAVGNVQSNKYGFRVRLKLGGKDYYGPKHKALESARLDLAKLNAEVNSDKRKARLLELKSEIGLRRGGRKPLHCRGVDDVEEEQVPAYGVPSCTEGRR